MAKLARSANRTSAHQNLQQRHRQKLSIMHDLDSAVGRFNIDVRLWESELANTWAHPDSPGLTRTLPWWLSTVRRRREALLDSICTLVRSAGTVGGIWTAKTGPVWRPAVHHRVQHLSLLVTTNLESYM